MTHKVVLSNNNTILIEEDDNAISIMADGMYICTISASGVLAMPNSGHAAGDAVCGLMRRGFLETLADVQGNVSIHDGIATLPDGTTIDMSNFRS